MEQSSPEPLDETALAKSCIELSSDKELGRIYSLYGVPPLWDRQPGFATLLQIILEQQVSLASAKACFDKLERQLGSVNPNGLLTLGDVELRGIGFSRQKASYARHLAETILDRRMDLQDLLALPDVEAKSELIKLKGVGEWTSDIYLLMALLRRDVMPKGDVALHSAWATVSGKSRPSADEFLKISERWRPHRSTAARLLWHFYLSERAMKRVSHGWGPSRVFPTVTKV